MRKLVTSMVAASPADMPMRRTSASNSDLARSVSYLTSRVISLTASETRSPTERSSTFAGFAVPGSAIALSSLLRPGTGSAGNLPCGPHRAARIRRLIGAAGQTSQAPCAVVTGRLRQEILRDHRRGAGQQARAAARLTRPVARASKRRSLRSAVAGHVRPGLPGAHSECRAARRGGHRSPGAYTPWPTALARLPRLVARGYPVAVPGPVGPVVPFYDGSGGVPRCCTASIGDLD